MKKAIVLSTWKHGVNANKKAWEILKVNGSSLDAVEQGVMVAESDPDRKSTRLNSSHKPISYAVFCLKKKTQQ